MMKMSFELASLLLSFRKLMRRLRSSTLGIILLILACVEAHHLRQPDCWLGKDKFDPADDSLENGRLNG